MQQLTVAFTNAFPNGSVDSLTMSNSASAAIVATNPLLTGGTWTNLYTALTWVTNPATSTLDLIYADAEQHKIWRLPGPLYKSPVVIFSWSAKGSGPAYPVGLAADPSGNVYVISPSSFWGKPGVWVLPINMATGGYGAPLLIDDTFTDPVSHKPVSTLALTEVAVAGNAAPAWGALDLLVLVADPSNTRVIRYSQAQIAGVLSSQPPFQGPASNVVTQPQFLTQAINKFAPIPVGMDIGQDPTTGDVTLLFSTVDGRILDFDSTRNAFITPYAINLGLGLTRVKVGTFQGVQYVFAGQLPGQILEFASPPSGSSNKTPFAKVSKGVSNPSDLAVTQSGSTTAGQCVAPNSCSILPQLSLQFSGPGTANIPGSGPIVADSCTIASDPRVTVTIVPGSPPTYTYDYVPLNLGTLCANFPNVMLSANVFGGSGPTGTGFYAAKITSGLNQYESINNTSTTPVNNTLTHFLVNPALVAGVTPPCGSPSGPVAAWGPIPGVESNIPEGTLVDITVACTSDPPPAGNSNHPSVITEGTVVAGVNATYIDGEFSNLQTAFNQIVTPLMQPPTTQIVDTSPPTIVPAIQGYITQSLNYFNQGVATAAAGGSPTPYYNCALNSLGTGARYVNSTVTANPGAFIAGPPPSDDENPSGTLLWRLDHLYYDVNIYAGNAPITTDALNPATTVPACTPPGPPLALAATPGTVGGTFGILTLTWTVNDPTYLPATTSCQVSTTDPDDSPSWVTPATVTLSAPPNNSVSYTLTDNPSSYGTYTISLNCSVNGAVVGASAPFTVVSPLTENTNLIFEEATGQGSAPPGIIDFLTTNVPVNGGCSMGDSDGLFTAHGTIPFPVSGVATNGFYYSTGQFDSQGFPHSVTWTLTCPDNPTPTPPVTVTYTVDAAATLALSPPGSVNSGTPVTLTWNFTDFPSGTTCTLSSSPTDANLPATVGIAAGGMFNTVTAGTMGNGSVVYTPSEIGDYSITLSCNGVSSTAPLTVSSPP